MSTAPEEAKHTVKINIYLLTENDVSIEIATTRKLGWRVERPGGVVFVFLFFFPQENAQSHSKNKGISDS